MQNLTVAISTGNRTGERFGSKLMRRSRSTHNWKDRLAAVAPKCDQMFCLGGCDSGGWLSLPAPTEQTQRTEASGEERERSGKRGGRRAN